MRVESHGVTLAVSANDLTLTQNHEAVPFFSFRAYEAGRFQAEFPPASTDAAQACARRISVTPVAWAGSFLSLQLLEETGCKLEAHPAGEARFVTLAITPGGATPVKVASLSDWIAESDLLAALRKDSVVQRALASSGAPNPASLADLLQNLEGASPVVSKQSCYAFPGDLLERFAPSHIQGSSLAVRLSLSGAAVCRTRLTELGLLLPLPAKLSAALLDAAAGRGGFLKRNAPPAVVQHPTVFELGPIPFAQAHP